MKTLDSSLFGINSISVWYSEILLQMKFKAWVSLLVVCKKVQEIETKDGVLLLRLRNNVSTIDNY